MKKTWQQLPSNKYEHPPKYSVFKWIGCSGYEINNHAQVGRIPCFHLLPIYLDGSFHEYGKILSFVLVFLINLTRGRR